MDQLELFLLDYAKWDQIVELELMMGEHNDQG